MTFGYYKNYLYTHRYKLSSEKKKGKGSQYMVSHPETGLDSPIGSDRESGRDSANLSHNGQKITRINGNSLHRYLAQLNR